MPSSEQNQVGPTTQALETSPSTTPPLDIGGLHARASYLGRQLLTGGGTADNSPLLKSPVLPAEQKIEPHSEVAAGDELVAEYLAAARSLNTRRAYRSDLRDFQSWGGHIPSCPDEIVRYLAQRASTLRPSTLSRRLAALASAHHDSGMPDPTKAPLVRRVVQGIKRRHGTATRQVAPLLLSDLARLIPTMGTAARDLRDRAILLVGFFGALRRSEIVALDWSDFACTSDGVSLHIARSKTDQTGQGRSLHLARRNDDLCPVQALSDLLAVLAMSEGAVFREEGTAGDRLSSHAVARIVKRRASDAGLNPERFSGHSLRAGFVTTAAIAGFDAVLIARQTGHRTQQALSAYARPMTALTLNQHAK